MVESTSAIKPNVLQKWGSLLTAVICGLGAIAGHFGDASFRDVMRLVLIGVVAAFVARRYWR